MERLWARIMARHRILQQAEAPCARGEEQEVLRELCRGFDIPAPMWLMKQEREYSEFGRTSFAGDNFLEEIRFDRLEIERLDDEMGSRTSDDPRNRFGAY